MESPKKINKNVYMYFLKEHGLSVPRDISVKLTYRKRKTKYFSVSEKLLKWSKEVDNKDSK